MSTKSKWSSRTIWANIVAMIALSGSIAGVDLGLDAETQAEIIVGIMAVVNIVLRFVTSEPIK